EIDVMQGAAEGEIDAVVEHAFALHALAHPGLDQEIACPLLDETGADAVFDIVAAAVLQHDRLDARQMQQMRQHQPGGPRPHDADLYAHARCSLESGSASLRGNGAATAACSAPPARVPAPLASVSVGRG